MAAKAKPKKGTALTSIQRRADLDVGYPLGTGAKRRIVTKPPIGKKYGSKQQKDREDQQNRLRNE